MVTKDEEVASFNSTLVVAELSFCGVTASHHTLLAPNTCSCTVEVASACETAHPRKITARTQNETIVDEFII